MANNKSATPGGNFAGAMGDPFELMKKMWSMTGIPEFPGAGAMSGGMSHGMPSMIAPTFDVEELDKRITDLRAVEQWLALNAGMLRATIQSLEVQRATIATLRGITDNMMAPMSKANAETPVSSHSFAFGQTSKGEEKTADWPPMPKAAAPATAPKPRARKSAAKQTTVGESTLNPAAWWNTLQNQFTQIAAAAAASAPPVATQTAAKKTAARKAAKKSSR